MNLAGWLKLYFVDNGKTTGVGLGLIATGIATAASAFPLRPESSGLLITAVSSVLAGVGMILSKDAKRVDEAPSSANPVQVAPDPADASSYVPAAVTSPGSIVL